jgi:hypothetical protein
MEGEKAKLIAGFHAMLHRPASRTPQEARDRWTNDPMWELVSPRFKAVMEAVWKDWEVQIGQREDHE